MREDFRGAKEKQEKEFEEKVVQISRVSKKTKGGNKLSFAVMMVSGDRKGRVGVGLGKAAGVPEAMKKASINSKKHLIKIPMKGNTIPCEIKHKKGAAIVFLKPAPAGTGVIAGGSVKAVLELAGVRDVLSKIIGSNNHIANVYATIEAMKKMIVWSNLQQDRKKEIAAKGQKG